MAEYCYATDDYDINQIESNNMKTITIFIIILFINVLTLQAQEDEITMESGIKLTGKILIEENEMIYFDQSGKTIPLLREDIRDVNVGVIETLTFTDVIQVEGVSKNELYNRARLWFIGAFVSADDVLLMENKQEGQLIGEGNFKFVPKMYLGSDIGGIIKFTIKLFVKDGRYKYVITEFVNKPKGAKQGIFGVITTDYYCPVKTGGSKKWNDKTWWNMKSDIYKNIPPLIADLIIKMEVPIESEDESW
jgi:hypothetical protein